MVDNHLHFNINEWTELFKTFKFTDKNHKNF